MRAAGARLLAAVEPLLHWRWERLARPRFLLAAAAAIAASATLAFPAHAPVDALRAPAAGDAGAQYVGFAAALTQAYREFLRDAALPGTEFDGATFLRRLDAATRREWPAPEPPETLGLRGPGAVALAEARARLMRLNGLGAREAHPQQSAAAQLAWDCWAERLAARRDQAAIDECAEKFHSAVLVIEDWLLPLRAGDVFNRRLAREYLAYANYKAAVEHDMIDARHFADKGLRTAEAAIPVEPEATERWLVPGHAAIADFAAWRQRLVAAIAAHRTGHRAAWAAVAQARFDCWLERAAGAASAAAIAKCRGEFIDAINQLEDRPAGTAALEGAAAEPVAVRFAYGHLALDGAERRKIAQAAQAALARNAPVSIVAVVGLRGNSAVEGQMSWRRADVVADAVAAAGVPAERIRVLQRAAVPADEENGRRRVEIVFD